MAAGVGVSFVTRHVTVAPLLETSLSAAPARERLFAGAFTLFPEHLLVVVERGAAIVRSLRTGREQRVVADLIVPVCRNGSERGPADGLRDRRSTSASSGTRSARGFSRPRSETRMTPRRHRNCRQSAVND